MNKAYRLIWSRAKDAWVIAAEIVKGNGGPPPITVSAIVVAASLALAAVGAHALPVAPTVANGAVNFGTTGNTLTVTNSPNSIINWQAFSIAVNETVKFNQQSALSAVLNRVTGVDPSQILGSLQSNGKVFLINPNGIIFGQGSRIDVAGLVASSLGISNQDFLAGNYRFTGDGPAGAVKNQGTITTTAGGMVWLISPNVENSGIINSPNGAVMLAAGQSVQMVDPQRPEIAVVVSAPADKAVNIGDVLVQGGSVGIYGSLVSQQGVVSADSVVAGPGGEIFLKSTVNTTLGANSITSANALDNGDGGRIVIWSDGTTQAAGNISATGGVNGGNGGFIETSSGFLLDFAGVRVNASSPKGKAGLWLIDPQDLTIDATGAGNISSTLQGGTNVTATTSACNPSFGTCSGTSGDIRVNSEIAWDTPNQLTLLADNNIHINAAITATDPNATVALYTPVTGNTTQTAPITAANLVLGGGLDQWGYLVRGGTFTLETPNNSIGTLTGDVTAVSLFNNKTLTVGDRASYKDLKAFGDIHLVADASGTPGQHGIVLDGYSTRSYNGNVYLKGTAGVGGSGIYITTNAGGESAAVGAYNGSITLKGYGGGAGGFGIGRNQYSGRLQSPLINVTASGGINIRSDEYGSVINLTNSGSGNINVTFENWSGTASPTVIGGSNSVLGGGFIIDGSALSNSGLTLSGITTSNGPVTVQSIRDVTFTGAINAGTGNVIVNTSAGAITGLTGVSSINANSASLSASSGIGATSPLLTAVNVLSASNNGTGDIQISNTGPLIVSSLINSGGSITLDNIGAVTLDVTGVYAGYIPYMPGLPPMFITPNCNISVTAHSPLTVNAPLAATGNVTLSAGPTPAGSTTDNLVISSTGSILGGNNVTLTAGNTVTMTGPVTYAAQPPNTGILTISQGLNPPPPPSFSPLLLTSLDVATFINETVWSMGRESTDLTDEDKEIYLGGNHDGAGNVTYCN